MSHSKKEQKTPDSDRKHPSSPVGAKRKPMFTRRRILVGGGSVLAAGALGVGGWVGYGWQQRFGRNGLATIPDHRVPVPATVPKMVIARGSSPGANTRAAIERMGGMRRFVSRDDVVLIKPNIGWDRTPAQAANTHPDVVAEVVRLCREAKPKRVIVCDCPVSNARKSFQLSGILKAATEAGAEVILPEESQYQQVEISSRLGTWDVLEPFVTATKIINVPVGKHHNLTGVTAGLKNWIGITTKLRMQFHGDINRSIADLAALMRPTLTVLDATRVLMAAGPQGGRLEDVQRINTVAVGTDPVALDSWAFSLFGSTPQDHSPALVYAEGMKLGVVDFGSLQPVEIVVS